MGLGVSIMELEVEGLTQNSGLRVGRGVDFQGDLGLSCQRKGNGCWKSNNRCLLNVGLGKGRFIWTWGEVEF